MNDFTKEELYKIYTIVVNYFSDKEVSMVNRQLINRIGSMIDDFTDDMEELIQIKRQLEKEHE